jgi:hypothetical protein
MRAPPWITLRRGRVAMICPWLGIVAAGFIELRLLLWDLPRHFVAHGVWTHIGVVLAAALLPLTILAALFRPTVGAACGAGWSSSRFGPLKASAASELSLGTGWARKRSSGAKKR